MKKIIEILELSKRISNSILNKDNPDNKDIARFFEKEDREYIINNLVDKEKLREQYLLRKKIEKSKSENWKKLEKGKKTNIRYLVFLGRVAAIFIGLFTTIYFIQIKKAPSNEIQISEEVIKLKVGKDNIKVIRQGETREIVAVSGEVLGIQNGNKIIYHTNPEIKELVYNELEVPYGKIFDIELSDGTIVHLNSGTSIKYPVNFLKGKKREVFIDGEAYFDVAKDINHPFIVNADSVAVEVLGTSFNISSYKEDTEIKTVLVEGKVNMYNTHSPNNKIILKPGYKGAWNKSEKHTYVEEVDTGLYIGWISGELIFRGSTFNNMVRKLERRYNVSISNNNVDLQNKKFNARFSVNVENIQDVMESINKISPFDYKIIDNQIIIY
ncbi:FecR family protein [Flavivirga spongiicola]|uniref:FecR family protein n=1 Tax=Flavivirga spongiicola TaxID=421621 RepID=A0ABU7XXK8_9FLAO|nr:FecR family protein [Flavivirga sp. MEBiC05379]MDO5979594.1 FecR family protein [Flavivirga sp. MEBiC05379]